MATRLDFVVVPKSRHLRAPSAAPELVASGQWSVFASFRVPDYLRAFICVTSSGTAVNRSATSP